MVRKKVIGFTALFVAFTFFLVAVQFALFFDGSITGFSVYDSSSYSGNVLGGFLALLLLGGLFILLVSLRPRYVMKNRYLRLHNLTR